MYDLSAKMESFYNGRVVLRQSDQQDLLHKKDLNVARLKEGMAEYNKEHKTSYSVVETYLQGSMAMSTIVQNDSNDYDIDVAVVFDKSAIGDISPLKLRRIVADAMERKTKQFNAKPEVKTSCVRIKYADGYHVDIPVFRRSQNWLGGYGYEHSNTCWEPRGLKELNAWFDKKNKESYGKLRMIVRLSKMFCKSRDSWSEMPSGLLQTVICAECLCHWYSRLDETLYYTMQNVVGRLKSDLTVMSPVEDRNLTSRKVDRKRMRNWMKRLESKLADLEILFSSDCTEAQAMKAWYGFFNNEFWNTDESASSSLSVFSDHNARSIVPYHDTEQFIDDFYEVNYKYSLSLNCFLEGNGFRKMEINKFLSTVKNYVPKNMHVYCSIKYTDVPEPYEVFWKVRNVGSEAIRRDNIRGQVLRRDKSIVEDTIFQGKHYIECYIVKDGICVARKRVDVPIGRYL